MIKPITVLGNWISWNFKKKCSIKNNNMKFTNIFSDTCVFSPWKVLCEHADFIFWKKKLKTNIFNIFFKLFLLRKVRKCWFFSHFEVFQKFKKRTWAAIYQLWCSSGQRSPPKIHEKNKKKHYFNFSCFFLFLKKLKIIHRYFDFRNIRKVEKLSL